MRIAVLSDIHGNLPALEAVLEALEPFEAVWQLGDAIGYGPDPEGVGRRLRQIGARGVCGNHEAAVLGRIDTSWFNEDARVAVEWTAEQLSPDARAWLAALPTTHVEPPFTLVHGSPRDPIWEYVTSTRSARAALDVLTTPYCLLGHTHDPLVFREVDGQLETLVPADGSVLHLDGRRALINPGSVGQPRDGDPRASAMLLDTDAATATWHRVSYPIATIQERMRAAHLPARLIQRLELGY